MISFMISVVPPKLDWTRLSRRSSQLRRAADCRSRWSRKAPSGQRGPRRSRGVIWAAITCQEIISPRRSSRSRGVAPTTMPYHRRRISQPPMRTSAPGGSLRHSCHRSSRDGRGRPRRPGAAVSPRASARQSAPRPGSGRSPRQHGHVRHPMTTAAARPSPAGPCLHHKARSQAWTCQAAHGSCLPEGRRCVFVRPFG